MVIIHSGRNPFQIWLLAACALAGVAGLIAPDEGNSAIVRLLPGWEANAWYIGLIVFGLIGLFGSIRGGATGLLIERVGMASLSGLTLAYAMAVVLAAGSRGAFAALLVAAFSGACITRFVQINKNLRALAQTTQGLRPEGD